MTIRRNTVLAAAFVPLSTASFAQNEEGFSGRVALGFLATSGNSESENLNASFGLNWDSAPWHHELAGSAVHASSDGVNTAEAYTLDWQTNYDFSETSYAFGLLAWNEDEFSGYDSQVRQAVGYGRRLIDNERHQLNAEIGSGARQADLRDGTTQDKAIIRLNADYTWTVSETSTFSQTFAIEAGDDNTYSEAVTSLTADVFGGVALVVSYTIKNNSDVPVGLEETDTFTAMSLEYSF